jgi:hypothetical protein
VVTEDKKEEFEERLREEFEERLDARINEAVDEWRDDCDVFDQCRADARELLIEELEQGTNDRLERMVEQWAEGALEAEEPDARERCEAWLRAEFEESLGQRLSETE